MEDNIKNEKLLNSKRNTPFKFSASSNTSQYIKKAPVIDTVVESYSQGKQQYRQVEFECIMCKINWVGALEGGNVCPECGEFLYSKQL